MSEELIWGLPVIGYLFLAGTGAGAVTVSGSVLLRGGGFGDFRFTLARYSALISPIPILIGTILILFELGQPFRAFNLFKLINLSPMSVGTWLLGGLIVVSTLYALTFLPPSAALDDRLHRVRTALAWLCVPFGLGVAVYTGVLLGAMPSRPFWNSPVLALMFMLSALSGGTASIILALALFHRKDAVPRHAQDYHNSVYLLVASDALLLAGELAAIFLFVMFAHLTIGSPKEAIGVILAGGPLAIPFWGLVVGIGILIPFVVEIAQIVPRLLYGRAFKTHRSLELAMPVVILIGGATLRYVVVVAGQITGPIGL